MALKTMPRDTSASKSTSGGTGCPTVTSLDLGNHLKCLRVITYQLPVIYGRSSNWWARK